MDPYLEPHWLDVHTSLNRYGADDLNARLPADLIASTEERVAVEAESGEARVYGPDVRIFEPPAEGVTVIESPADTAVATQFRLLAQIEPITERYIRVIEAGSERLVTVIEFVSPTNKRGAEGIQAFRSKRASLLASGVNFVEIDLVRAGDWRALLRPHSCPRKGLAPYRYTVRLAREPAAVYLEPIGFRKRLPAVPIPLRQDDPEVRLELQPLIDRAYVNGRYDRRKIYARPLDPPLEVEDVDWAASLVNDGGRH